MPDAFADPFASLLRTLFNERCIPSAVVAAEVGVSLRTLQYWLAGRSRPKPGALQGLIKVLEVGHRDRAQLIRLYAGEPARL